MVASSKDGHIVRGFERRTLRMIYGSINDNGTWRTGHNNELYTPYDEQDIDILVRTGRLKWLGHHCRMEELDPCRMLIVNNPLNAD